MELECQQNQIELQQHLDYIKLKHSLTVNELNYSSDFLHQMELKWIFWLYPNIYSAANT